MSVLVVVAIIRGLSCANAEKPAMERHRTTNNDTFRKDLIEPPCLLIIGE